VLCCCSQPACVRPSGWTTDVPFSTNETCCTLELLYTLLFYLFTLTHIRCMAATGWLGAPLRAPSLPRSPSPVGPENWGTAVRKRTARHCAHNRASREAHQTVVSTGRSTRQAQLRGHVSLGVAIGHRRRGLPTDSLVVSFRNANALCMQPRPPTVHEITMQNAANSNLQREGEPLQRRF